MSTRIKGAIMCSLIECFVLAVSLGFGLTVVYGYALYGISTANALLNELCVVYLKILVKCALCLLAVNLSAVLLYEVNKQLVNSLHRNCKNLRIIPDIKQIVLIFERLEILWREE